MAPFTLSPYPPEVADRMIADGWLKGAPFTQIMEVVGLPRCDVRETIVRLALPDRDHKRRVLPLEVN